jgi:predicted flavoprotein YhiN
MKAKKSSPKTIRFNLKDFEEGMLKGKFESAQEMVDILLRNYVQEGGFEIKTRQQVTNITKVVTKSEKDLSKGEILKLMREGKM